MVCKRRKKAFHRQYSHMKKRVGERWRRPRGKYSKQREKHRRYGARPNPGWGQPRAIRGLHPSGYVDVRICNVKELEQLDPKRHAVRIAAGVGKAKRRAIIEAADKMGLKVLNRC